MPFGQLYFFAQIVVSLTRLTPDDVYLTTTPLFHGNAQFMAAYPALVAGGRAVIRPKFSASRWIDHVRDSGVTVTNFVGVMMDFAWKQAPRENDRDNVLRCVYAAPTASTYRRAVQGAVRHRGVRRRLRPHRDLRADHVAVRRAAAAGCRRAAEQGVVRHPAGRPRDRPRGRRSARSASSSSARCIRGPPATATTTCPRRPSRRGATCWFHTGDALRRDEDGWYYFIDRYKDALRRRGENISSYEVEQAILGHPAVVECAVIGVPADQEAGEDEVLAVVVASEPVDAAEILDLVRGPHPCLRHPALPARRVGAAQDAVREGPQGRPARGRHHS